MKNFIKPADVVTLTAPYDVLSGKGMLVGTLFAVATYDALSGAEVEGAIVGQMLLDKSVVGAAGGAQGANAYWIAGTKLVTALSAGNTLIGKFAKTCVDADTTCEVILLP